MNKYGVIDTNLIRLLEFVLVRQKRNQHWLWNDLDKDIWTDYIINGKQIYNICRKVRFQK